MKNNTACEKCLCTRTDLHNGFECCEFLGQSQAYDENCYSEWQPAASCHAPDTLVHTRISVFQHTPQNHCSFGLGQTAALIFNRKTKKSSMLTVSPTVSGQEGPTSSSMAKSRQPCSSATEQDTANHLLFVSGLVYTAQARTCWVFLLLLTSSDLLWAIAISLTFTWNSFLLCWTGGKDTGIRSSLFPSQNDFSILNYVYV